MDCLKMKVDSTTMILKSLKFPNWHWQPVIDKTFAIKDRFIPDDPLKLLKKIGTFDEKLKSIIIGHNTEEGLKHMASFIQNPILYKNISVQLPSILFPGYQIDKKLIYNLKR